MDRAMNQAVKNEKTEKPKGASRASYLLGLDFKQLSAHESATGAALDLEPHSSKIAEMLRHGIHPTTILKIVSARLGISHYVAAHAIQICLNGTGVEFKLPRGHRPKKTTLGDDLNAETVAVASPVPAANPVTANPTPTSGAKKDANPRPAAQSAAPHPQSVATPPASNPPAARPPTPFPEIPRGDLTHTERAEIAKKWIAEQFGDRHPTQVKPDELTPAAQEWLEKLWDKTAPVNPKTGQPYAFKRFTPDGRLTYDEPCWPPEAVAMENSKSGYHPVHDAAVRETIKRYGLRLIATSERLMEIRDKNGKYCVGGFGQDDAPCLVRSVRETAYAIEEERKHGILY
jgi:hypothetical protein